MAKKDDADYEYENNNRPKKLDTKDISKKVAEAPGAAIEGGGRLVEGAGRTIQDASMSAYAAASTVEAAAKTAGEVSKRVQNVGQVMQQSGQALRAGAEAGKAASGATKAAGEGVSAASDTALAAGEGASATGAGAIVGVPVAVAGAAGKVLGTAATVGGTVGEAASTVAEGAATGLEKGGQATEKAGELGENVSDAVEKGAEKAKQVSKKGIKTGAKTKYIGKGVKTAGKEIKDAQGKRAYKLTPSLNRLDGRDPSEVFDETAKDVGKKAVKHAIKKHRERSKRKIRVTDIFNPFKMAKKIIRNAVHVIKQFIKFSIIFFVITTICVYIIVQGRFSAIYEAVQIMNEKWDSVSLQLNKESNLYAGFGYQTTKDVFYDELDYLYEKYDEQLDIPLILATLYYTEQGTNDTDYDLLPEIDDGQVDIKATALSILNEIKTKYEQIYETTDEDGMNYTIGKVYRLRRLARNQMESTLFGNGAIPTGDPEEISVYDFLVETKDEFNIEFGNWLESIPSITQGLDIGKQLYNFINVLAGEENIDTTSWTNNEFEYRSLEILNSFVVDSYELSKLHLCSSGICVYKYSYEASDDNYKEYLRKYYIRNMPEYKKLIGTLKGDSLDEEIEKIIRNIYAYAEEFDEIYGYKRNVSGEDDDLECQGTVDLELVSHLSLPVNSDSFSFDDETGYGVSGTTQNNGVNLTAQSAGISEGDEVKAVAAGSVKVHKNNCNTSNNSSCNPLGTYIEIEHTIKATDKTFSVTSVYANLKDVTLKKKNGKYPDVKKGDVIGHIGKTGDVSEPTLHFELKTGEDYYDPTNLFIECETTGGGDLINGANDEVIFCYLTKKLKYSLSKATGTMANLQTESGFEPTRVQGDYSEGYKESKEYTKKVDSKKISRNDFVNHGPGGGGYGLAQWTWYELKEDLYDYMKKDKSRSIGDMQGQLEFLGLELNDKKSWSRLYSDWNKAKSSISDTDKATRAMMLGYEKPQDQSASAVAGRQANGKALFKKFKKYKCASASSMSNLSSSVSGQTKAKNKTHEQKLKIVFPKGVPSSESELKKYLVSVKVPITTKNGKKSTTTVTVHKKIAADVVAALQAAQDEGFRVYEIGGYRTFGSDTAGKVKDVGLVYSQHCYGLAVDINVNENCHKPGNGACATGVLWNPKGNRYSISTKTALYKSFISNGWGWGGEWNSSKDYMHFSFFGT